ncbi:MAG TPA: leucine-rich repeat domain-containing protein [Leptospiraceae bacterium]|nr:leucine-rich repeat domain-containing protein [Leptospiraceae bacterium]
MASDANRLNLKTKAYNKTESLLDAGRKNLNEIPREVFEQKKLKHLILCYNQIRNLPDTFDRLPHLKSLDLCGNQLQSLPESIRNLKKLEELNLSGNLIAEFPKLILELPNLKILKLNDLNLASVPKELGKLKHLSRLEIFSLQKFDMKSLITAFAHSEKELFLTQGEEINTKGRNAFVIVLPKTIDKIPKEIYRLKNLIHLSVCDSGLKTVSKEIGALRKMEGLFLSGNQIVSLPAEIGRLKNLKCTDLSFNKFSAFPKILNGLRKMEEIIMNGNSIETVPAEIGGFSELKTLSLTETESEMSRRNSGNFSSWRNCPYPSIRLQRFLKNSLR